MVSLPAPPQVGDLVTVLPHKMICGAWTCGRWHGRIRSYCRNSTQWIWVQQVREVDGAWKPGMTTQARIDKLVPIEVQLDLFGQPAGGARW